TASNSTALGNSALASANNSVALGQGSVADRANSVSVGTVGGERQITNVAAGVAPTDAVNVSQLDALGSKVNQYFNAANKRIDKVDNNARAGIAAAMAAGTLPQSTLPGKSMVTVGASTYRGESALALGVSRLSDNARTVIKANASADSRGNAGAAVGAGWHW
ncbi:MAG: adhesin, partial [Gammaproteobacteria bacterium]|nr:adhesin [Gammaproteobacteria bacterium]